MNLYQYYFAELNLQTSLDPLVTLINAILQPLLLVFVAYMGIEAVICGYKLSKSNEPQEQAMAKQKLRQTIFGFFCAFGLLVVFRLAGTTLITWVGEFYKEKS